MMRSDHETFMHPVACVLVVSSNNDNPVKSLVDLFSPQRPPDVIRRLQMDPNILRFHLMVHDARLGSSGRADSSFRELRQTFGKNYCHLLTLNSAPPESPIIDRADLWSSSIPLGVSSPILDAAKQAAAAPPKPEEPSPQSGGASRLAQLMDEDPLAHPNTPEVSTPTNAIGAFLTDEDVTNLKRFVKDLNLNFVAPHIERTIRTLNDLLAERRRGLRAQFKSFFGRRGDSSPPPGSQKGYPHTSVEAQLRQIADLAFLLRDYDTALQHYRLASSDFKADRAHRHYAGTQEMIALCHFMMDPSRRDLDKHWDAAMESYQRAGETRWATRSLMLCYDTLRSRSLFRDATPFLIRSTTSEGDLRSALFLEQAADCFLRQSPTKFHQWAFHLILAGHRYSQCKQRAHSAHCYRHALAAYEGREWSLAEDHIHFSLGRHAYFLGFRELAIQFFSRLLKDSQQSQERQKHYLREFLYVWKMCIQAGLVVAEAENLPLPSIVNESMTVLLTDDLAAATPSSASFAKVPDSRWTEMAADFQVKPSGRLTPNPTFEPVEAVDGRTVIGERVHVQFVLKNTLAIPLSLTGMQLCAHRPRAIESGPLLEFEEAARPFNVEPVDLILQGGERRVVRLVVVPTSEGPLHIDGVEYSLNGSAIGRFPFKLRGRRLNDTLEQRCGRVYAPNHTLELNVVGPMPRLEVEFDPLPPVLYHGERTCIGMTVRNVGRQATKRISARLSHPAFFHFELDKDKESPTLPAGQPAWLQRPTLPNVVPDGKALAMVRIPLGAKGELAPGEERKLKLYVRGDGVGTHVFRFLFHYEPCDGASMPFRRLRGVLDLRVAPSLRLSVATYPRAGHPLDRLLALEIENLQDARVELSQLSTCSGNWKIHPLVGRSNAVIGARQVTWLYFVAQHQQSLSHDAAPPIMLDGVQATDTPAFVLHTLLPLGAKPVYDTSGSPFQDFSRNERAYRVAIQRRRLIKQSAPRRANVPSGIITGNLTAFGAQDRSEKKVVVKDSLYLEPGSLHVMLLWNTEDGQHHGQHHCFDTSIVGPTALAPLPGATRGLSAPGPGGGGPAGGRGLGVGGLVGLMARAEATPLQFVLEAPELIEHSFEQMALCAIDVVVRVTNRNPLHSVDVLLEAINPGESGAPPAGADRCLFIWTNIVRHSIRGLLPQESATVRLSACVRRPGVYGVAALRAVTNLQGASETVSYCPAFEHLVHVRKL